MPLRLDIRYAAIRVSRWEISDARLVGIRSPATAISDDRFAAEVIASSLAWSAGSVSEIPVAMNLVRP
jgi:hypothetical protein